MKLRPNEARPSVRAQIVTHRTYLRPLDEQGKTFETPEQAIDRVIKHQRWLWERAQHKTLEPAQQQELEELRTLMLEHKVTVSGRTRWLGGTEIAKRRESSQFNCSHVEVETVHDMVDVLWLLLQGCGVGFTPVVGSLNGFQCEIPEFIVQGEAGYDRTLWEYGDRGSEDNGEHYDPTTGTWIIQIGDSAEAWAKSIGKIMAGKYPAKRFVLDTSQIRPAGQRLKGYGWISSGPGPIIEAYRNIFAIMNRRAGQLLTKIDILDIVNWLGTILSTRRSAQIALVEYGSPEWREFATAKKDFWATGNVQRAQSNNSLVFYDKPTRYKLRKVFEMMLDAGGSEPGFVNGAAARRRAPWYKGLNPCAEILLGNRSFCNLVETVVFRFNGDEKALHRAHYLVARANYRQTCVNLDDGVLQRGWHELNQFLRLCGVGVTGVVAWELADEAEAWAALREVAVQGAHSMADELGLPRAKAVTTIKPSGTQSKALSIEGLEIPEGIHKPLGRFIFNNIGFGKHDPLVKKLKRAGYHVFDNPFDPTGVLARVPVEYSNINFDKAKMVINGRETEVEVNLEPAVSQLERYKLTMENYVDHNTSITISYDPSEVEDIVSWLLENWDTYVGVSFILRNDPTKTAQDLGYAYLPQEVVDEETFRIYAAYLKPIDFTGTDTVDEIELGDQCATGACPIR